MKIRHVMILSHLVVGTIPLAVVFGLLTHLLTIQAGNDARSKVNTRLEEGRRRMDKEMENFQTFVYFFKRSISGFNAALNDYRFNNFNLNIALYSIPVLEFTLSNKKIRSYFGNVMYAPYASSDQILDRMWNVLSGPFYNPEHRMFFPDLAYDDPDNPTNRGGSTVVVRNCAIIYDFEKNEKIGLSIISVPLTSVFLSQVFSSEEDIVYFIQTGSNFAYSRPEFGQYLSDTKIDFESEAAVIVDVEKAGRFYSARLPLYFLESEPIAYIGILYGFSSLNRITALFQVMGVTAFLVSLVISVFISITFSNRITNPITALKNMVSGFRLTGEPVPLIPGLAEELSELQDSFREMSGRITEYRNQLESYNDHLTGEIEKKTLELMNQLRSLMLINNFSSIINQPGMIRESVFIKYAAHNLVDVLKLRYIAVFDLEQGHYHKMAYRYNRFYVNTGKDRKRLRPLELKMTARCVRMKQIQVRRTDKVFILAAPVLYENVAEYAVFFVGDLQRKKVVMDTLDTLLNMIFLKIHAIRVQKAQLENEKMATIGQFASTVVHDIKNPLTVIRGLVEVLGDPDFTVEEKLEYQDVLKYQIERLTNLLNDILDYSKGTIKPVKEDLDLSALAADIARFYQRSAQSRNVSIILDTVSGCRVSADKYRIFRALGNLVQNAVDAQPDGGSVEIITRELDDGAEIRIKDKGPGIPDEIKKTMFEPFNTLGKSGGTGLGLSIVQKIVESHRGKLGFETSDTGTLFKILLPRNG